MRRTDREITAFEDIIAIVDGCDVIHLAMTAADGPYVLPLNFGYAVKDGRLEFYLHSAAAGHKIDLLRRSPAVAFAMVSHAEIRQDNVPCKWSCAYASAAGRGQAVFLTDPDERQEALEALMRHYGFKGQPHFGRAALDRICLIRIDVSAITAKSNKKA